MLVCFAYFSVYHKLVNKDLYIICFQQRQTTASQSGLDLLEHIRHFMRVQLVLKIRLYDSHLLTFYSYSYPLFCVLLH